MRRFLILILIAGIGITGVFLPAQEEESKISFYIRATFYPTFSLSRYDYNNYIDHVEIRSYIELRRDSACGNIIENAEVTVNGEKLDFKDNRYEKRINIPKESLSEEIIMKITISEGIDLEKTYSVPDWLVIKAPRPSIIGSSEPLSITWDSLFCAGPVKIEAYDFKTGDSIIHLDNFKENKTVIPKEKIPEDSLLRILVMHTWLFKQYIRGEHIAKGSEVNIMPWSQVFIRTQ
ncbi:MAG: hypothetical protein ACOC5S_03420 [Acidobacteriota bacterium]